MAGVKNADKRPYSVHEPSETVGTRPEPNYDSSPDVEIDGSVSSEDEQTVEKSQRDQEVSHSSGYLVAFLLLGLAIVLLFAAIYI